MAKVLIVTATKVEAEEVLAQFSQASGTDWERCFIGRKTYCALGEVGGVELFMVQSEMGSIAPGGALLTVSEAIRELAPVAVIMVGICFGANREKQKIGDILVSKQLHSYEPQKKVKGNRGIPRGDTVTASEDLLDKFRSGHLDWKGAEVQFGLMLSGEKLINAAQFFRELLEQEPEALGGEMEGAGLYVAARYASVPWIIVKAICDWADGKKKDKPQRTAAQNAAAFTLHVIQQGGFQHLSGSGPRTTSVFQPAKVWNQEQRSAVRSTIPGRYGKPFVGRDDELGKMAEILKDTSREKVLVLHGQSGAGKSELGFEFARTQQSRYPGGTFLIRAGSSGVAIDLASIGKNILCLQLPADLKLEEQALTAFHNLGSAPTLLVYDNVLSPDEIREWLPLARKPCHAIITTVFDAWPSGWPIVHVDPFSDEKALDLVQAIGGDEILKKYGQKVADHCQGLPIQIVPLAETLTLEHKRNLDKYVEFKLTDDADASFSRVYDRLTPDQKILLHAAAHLNPQRILRDHLFRHLLESEVMKDRKQVIATLNACMDVTILQGGEELRMHQLMADFLTRIPMEKRFASKFKKIRQTQAGHLLEAARHFLNARANANLAAELTAFPLSDDAWRDIKKSFSGAQAHDIGYVLSELGQWATAISWFERAVEAFEKKHVQGGADYTYTHLGESLDGVGTCFARLGNFKKALLCFERAVKAKEKGDSDRRVDCLSLGGSLDGVGFCYAQLGDFKKSLLWYMRAVKVKEKGDTRGRVDHRSLGKSLHSVGQSFAHLRQFEKALSWVDRAVTEHEKGDVHGRVDHACLGHSLAEAGLCYSSLGKFDEAIPWVKRAAQEAEKGDMHGRVDHDGLGATLAQLGWCYWNLGKFEEALPWLERGVAEQEKGDVYGTVHHDKIGKILLLAGTCHSERGRLEESLPLLERAIVALEKGDIHGMVDEELLQAARDFRAHYLTELGRL